MCPLWLYGEMNKNNINNIMDKKQEIIGKIYHDPSGYGSLKTTLDDAKKIDKTITLNDIKEFSKC